jgi:hypothetical protein
MLAHLNRSPTRKDDPDEREHVLATATADGPARWLASIADPAGNAVGIVAHVRR